MEIENKAELDRRIAEYMGFKDVMIDLEYNQAYCHIKAPICWQMTYPKGIIKNLDFLKWDELMPVIKKAEEFGGKIEITTDIKSTYLNVVKYIDQFKRNNLIPVSPENIIKFLCNLRRFDIDLKTTSLEMRPYVNGQFVRWEDIESLIALIETSNGL